MTKIHFVCTGNVFRSRLAEAYAHRRLSDRSDIQVTSSGVAAANATDGPIAWYALKLVKDDNLIPYISQLWTQTTADILKHQDLIVFMQPLHYEFCQQNFGYSGTNHQIWDVSDVTPDMTDYDLMTFCLKQFGQIRDHIDQLIVDLNSAKHR